MKSRPLVSVCIPTYNGRHFIAQTLECVLKQSYGELDIVVSDHDSSDDTLDLVRDFKDSRIRILHKPRTFGVADNWNSAVSAAYGKLIKVIGQDDLLYAGAIESQVETMSAASPDVSFCFSRRCLIGPSDQTLRRCSTRRFKVPRDSPSQLRLVARFGGNYFGEPLTVLFRYDAWESIGGFQGAYLIDLDFYVRLLAKGRAIPINQCVGAFRVQSNSWGSGMIMRQFSIVPYLFGMRRNHRNTIRRTDVAIGVARAILRTPLRILVQQTVGRVRANQ